MLYDINKADKWSEEERIFYIKKLVKGTKTCNKHSL
jgi:hypothetical protein